MATAIKTNYEEINKAYQALTVLIKGGLQMDGGKPFIPSYSVKTVLKIKRTISALSPLVEQFNEVRDSLKEKYNWSGSGAVPASLEQEFLSALRADLEINAEMFSVEELLGDDKVPASIVALLMDLTPFLESED